MSIRETLEARGLTPVLAKQIKAGIVAMEIEGWWETTPDETQARIVVADPNDKTKILHLADIYRAHDSAAWVVDNPDDRMIAYVTGADTPEQALSRFRENIIQFFDLYDPPRYVSFAYRPKHNPTTVRVDIQDTVGKTVGSVIYEGLPAVLLPMDIAGVTPKEIDRAVKTIADFLRRERAPYKADLGTPEDGPVWTVVGGYEDEEDHSIFHIHAQDLDDLSMKIHKAKKLYEWVLDSDTAFEEHEKYPTLPMDFHPHAIFEGALVSKI